MARIFLDLFDFFDKRKPLFWATFIFLIILLGAGASQIKIEEDISKFLPDDERAEKLSYILQNSKFAERIVIMVSARDSSMGSEPDSLVALTEKLVAQISKELSPYVTQIASRVDEEKIMGVFQNIYSDLPFFLEEHDYKRLDSITQPETIRRVLQANYQRLISPAGITTKKIIMQDPLGLSFLALHKLQQVQYDENFELYDGYLVTKDHRHLIFFITPFYPPVETGNNSKFITALDTMLERVSTAHPDVKVSYFGSSAVAVGNALQLRKDTGLTLSLIVILLALFLIGFFRKGYVLFLILIPVLFGGLFSLCSIFLFKGSVSILAIAAGAMILGIAVNYGLHFLAHVRHTHDVKGTIKDLVGPMTLGSMTTVLAFFCLQFTNAAVLRDVGLFAGFSLIGAALCSLVFLPHFIPKGFYQTGVNQENWIERIPFTTLASKKYLVFAILLATPVFFFFARRVEFDNDMNKLNYMNAETLEAQKQLIRINGSAMGSVFVVSSGNDIQEALRKNEQVMPILQRLKDSHQINRFSSVSTFLISDSLQKIRIKKWYEYWTQERKLQVLKTVRKEGTALKFSEQVLKNFEALISREYKSADPDGMNVIRTEFFGDPVIEKDHSALVISILNVDPSKKTTVYGQLEKAPVRAFDRQMLTNIFVAYVNADFNFIVTFTAVLVFVSLLISYGRLELAIITFVPMFITWIWILGIMALAGIQFNIVNVMVSTFIFGLGDDYSIFIMDGLQQGYKTGQKNLPFIRTSIFLSALTTIAGLGVLIFAKHPAMRSIAVISMIGIVCVFIMSQTIEPYLFQALITERTRKNLAPMTITGLLRSILYYFIFVIGAFFLTFFGLLLRWVPIGQRQCRLLYHHFIRFASLFLIYIDPNFTKRIIGRTPDTLSKACVVIANHTSFLDILLVTMLHPKLILLTNTWVWNSPLFGGVVRLADYYPVGDGVEKNIARLRQRVKEGYSIVVFPEGTRSEDGRLKRFHKGAFYLAETLNLSVQPLLIHGVFNVVGKGSFYLFPGQITLKFLPIINSDDSHFGNTYSERCKTISRYFKLEYAMLAHETESPGYFSRKLISNYLYKGPVLEWYLRVKLRMEKNYELYHSLLPRKGSILDLGCGYGFLCYMLQFLSLERNILGVDFDEEKIETANHGFLKTDQLRFCNADVTQFELEKQDGIVISDVLHYLQPEAQEHLLERCFEALLPGGILILRVVRTDWTSPQSRTVFEFLSIKLFRFNKTSHGLNFLPGDRIRELAKDKGLSIEVASDAKLDSCVTFVIRK